VSIAEAGAGEAAERLEALAENLAGRGFHAHVMQAHGQVCACVSNRSAPQLSKTIYAAPAADGSWWFWWSWADRIALVSDIETAAFKISYLLSPMQTTDPTQPVHDGMPFPPSHHGHHSAGGWPLRAGLELGPLPGAAPSARAHAKQVLWEWGQAELADDVGVVVTELITNAVVASRRLPSWPPVRLWLVSDDRLVLVLVGDASQRPPLQLDPGLDADGGRGLRLVVAALSSRWGWYPAASMGTAKVVWAEWDCSSRGEDTDSGAGPSPQAGGSGGGR
jgi:hypothetical protein